MNSDLNGKVVLVTGGAGGIGSEICRTLMKEGAHVAIHYHTKKEEAEALMSLSSHSCAIHADLTREEETANLFHTVEEDLGPVDILIANAGIWVAHPTPIHKMNLEQWNRTITTNLTSMFLCFREFFKGIERHALADPSGVIIGSTAGIYGEAGHADYAASKAAASFGLLLSLKNEIVRLSPKGRVNAVCPSWIVTPLVESFASEAESVKRCLQTVPLRKLGTVSDVARAAVFLASPSLSGHISGQSITVAGGMEGRVLFEKDEI